MATIMPTRVSARGWMGRVQRGGWQVDEWVYGWAGRVGRGRVGWGAECSCPSQICNTSFTFCFLRFPPPPPLVADRIALLTNRGDEWDTPQKDLHVTTRTTFGLDVHVHHPHTHPHMRVVESESESHMVHRLRSWAVGCRLKFCTTHMLHKLRSWAAGSRHGTPWHERGARCKLLAMPCAALPVERNASTARRGWSVLRPATAAP